MTKPKEVTMTKGAVLFSFPDIIREVLPRHRMIIISIARKGNELLSSCDPELPEISVEMRAFLEKLDKLYPSNSARVTKQDRAKLCKALIAMTGEEGYPLGFPNEVRRWISYRFGNDYRRGTR